MYVQPQPATNEEKGTTMAVRITPHRYKQLLDEWYELLKKLDSERKDLADARGDDHEPLCNVQLLDVAERIGTIQGRIDRLEEIIDEARITAPCQDVVGVGSKVLLELKGSKDCDRILVRIDGYGDLHQEVPILTPDAPMIQKIMGLKEKEEATFISPNKEEITITVVEVGTYC